MHDDGIPFHDVSEAMETVYETEIANYKMALRDHLLAYPDLEQEMYLQAREDLIRSERRAIGEAARRGIMSDDLQDELTEESDKRLAALQLIRENKRWRVEVVTAKREEEPIE